MSNKVLIAANCYIWDACDSPPGNDLLIEVDIGEFKENPEWAIQKYCMDNFNWYPNDVEHFEVLITDREQLMELVDAGYEPTTGELADRLYEISAEGGA
jgi:hypothetical protein